VLGIDSASFATELATEDGSGIRMRRCRPWRHVERASNDLGAAVPRYLQVLFVQGAAVIVDWLRHRWEP
jgi:hypothetical protein